MNVHDILLDDNLDIAVEHGDFAVGESTGQHQTLLLLTNKGEWKQSPERGVGAVNFIETANPAELAREIRSDFSADGMYVSDVTVKGTKLDVEAAYE